MYMLPGVAYYISDTKTVPAHWIVNPLADDREDNIRCTKQCLISSVKG